MNISFELPLVFIMPPALAGAMIVIIAGMVVYWIWKFVVSLYTGA